MARPAEAHLARVDPVMSRLIEAHGPCGLPLRRRRAAPFPSLVKAIVSQMLSTQAASTIYGRLEALGAGVTPAAVLGSGEPALRAAGLSRTKADAILALARQVESGALDLPALCRDEDAAISSALLAIRGVGPWTVDMFLMFQLARPDVFPAGDLGVREGLRRAYALDARPSPTECRQRAAPWAPYRSTAAWYLWRALEA